MTTWKTVKESVMIEAEKIKGSRFIGYLSPIEDKKAALTFLAQIRREHPKARHWCYAYRLGKKGEISHYYDDGEPTGSAGKPILQHLEGAEITNIIAVVVRYFGGTKLGVGGLARAYSATTRETLIAATITKIISQKRSIFTIAYHHEPTIRNLLPRFSARIIHAVWTNEVMLTCEMPETKALSLEAAIREATSGRAKISHLS